MKKTVPILLLATSLFAEEECASTPPASCNMDSSNLSYCAGPVTTQSNSPVRPYTCDGDIEIRASALYWKASQDGMVFGLRNQVEDFDPHELVDAEYLTPKSESRFGGKIGLLYASPCDGWEVGATYTNFKGKAHIDVETQWLPNGDPNYYYLTPVAGESFEVLWTAFVDLAGSQKMMASGITNNWDCQFHVVDFELGRSQWVSKKLIIRPKIGLKILSITQNNDLEFRGGWWSFYYGASNNITQPSVNGFANLKNDFKGEGIYAGIDLDWKISCGWSLYSCLAASSIYGKFDVDHQEWFREAETPFSKVKILDTKNNFRRVSGILDLELGVQWMALICECKYGLTLQLGWEQHLFFHQNQMWDVSRVNPGTSLTFPNATGENSFTQRRGTLSTQGVTFTVKFDF